METSLCCRSKGRGSSITIKGTFHPQIRTPPVALFSVSADLVQSSCMEELMLEYKYKKNSADPKLAVC